MLTISKSLVEKLPSFVKLVSPFRKPIYSAFLVRFVVSFFDPTQLPLDSSLVAWLWCSNARNVYSQMSLLKDEAN